MAWKAHRMQRTEAAEAEGGGGEGHSAFWVASSYNSRSDRITGEED